MTHRSIWLGVGIGAVLAVFLAVLGFGWAALFVLLIGAAIGTTVDTTHGHQPHAH